MSCFMNQHGYISKASYFFSVFNTPSIVFPLYISNNNKINTVFIYSSMIKDVKMSVETLFLEVSLCYKHSIDVLKSYI